MQRAEKAVDEAFEDIFSCIKCDSDQDQEIEKEQQRELREERRIWRKRDKLGIK